MSKNNLELWKKVEKTNPNYTKKAKVGSINITTIAPQYQIMMVTEQFGVYGEAWGFKNITLSYDLAAKFNIVVFKGTFFFPKGEFEIINSCKLYMDRNLTMLDDNFAKKMETDSLTKAISKLGFNADIFLGKFEDVRYMNALNEEFKSEAQKESEAKRDAYVKAESEKKKEVPRNQTITEKELQDLKAPRNINNIQWYLDNRKMAPDQRRGLILLQKSV